MKKLLFLGLSLIVLSTACNKSSNDGKSRKENLTSGKWYVRASTIHITGFGIDSTQDVFAAMPACQKDNFIQFDSDGTGVSDEGATKCDTSAPQTTPGTWKFIDNDTRLVVAEAGAMPDTLNVTELNESTLKTTSSYSLLGLTISAIITMGH